jgi:hypothetical protein
MAAIARYTAEVRESLRAGKNPVNAILQSGRKSLNSIRTYEGYYALNSSLIPSQGPRFESTSNGFLQRFCFDWNREICPHNRRTHRTIPGTHKIRIPVIEKRFPSWDSEINRAAVGGLLASSAWNDEFLAIEQKREKILVCCGSVRRLFSMGDDLTSFGFQRESRYR